MLIKSKSLTTLPKKRIFASFMTAFILLGSVLPPSTVTFATTADKAKATTTTTTTTTKTTDTSKTTDTTKTTDTSKATTSTKTTAQVTPVSQYQSVNDYEKTLPSASNSGVDKAYLDLIETNRAKMLDNVLSSPYFRTLNAYGDINNLILNNKKPSAETPGEDGYYIYPITRPTSITESDKDELAKKAKLDSKTLAAYDSANYTGLSYYTVKDIASNPDSLTLAKFRITVGGKEIELFSLDTRANLQDQDNYGVYYSNIITRTLIHKAVFDFNKQSAGGKNSKASDLVVCLDSYGNIVTNTGELIYPFYGIPYYYERGTIDGLTKPASTAKVDPLTYNPYGQHYYPQRLLESTYGGLSNNQLTGKAIQGDKYFFIADGQDGNSLLLTGNYNYANPFDLFLSGSASIDKTLLTNYSADFKKNAGFGAYFDSNRAIEKPPIYTMHTLSSADSAIKLAVIGSKTAPPVINKELMQLIALGVREKMITTNDFQSFGHADAKVMTEEERQKKLNDVLQADILSKIAMIFNGGAADLLIATLSGIVNSIYVTFYLPTSQNVLFFTQNVTSMPIVSYFSKNLVFYIFLTIMFFAVFDTFRIISKRISFKKYFKGFIIMGLVWIIPFWIFPKFIDYGVNGISSLMLKSNIVEVTTAQRFQYLKLNRENGSLQKYIEALNTKANLVDIIADEASYGSKIRIKTLEGTDDIVDTNKYIDRYVEPLGLFSQGRLKQQYFEENADVVSFYPFVYDNLLRILTPEESDLLSFHAIKNGKRVNKWTVGKHSENIVPKNIIFLDSFNREEDFMDLSSILLQCSSLVPSDYYTTENGVTSLNNKGERAVKEISKNIAKRYKSLLTNMPNNMDKYALMDVLALIGEFEINKYFDFSVTGLLLQDVNMDLMTRYLLVPKEVIATDSIVILSNYIAVKDNFVIVGLLGAFVLATVAYSVMKMLAFYALCILVFIVFAYTFILKEESKDYSAVYGALFLAANLLLIQLGVIMLWLGGEWFINATDVSFSALPKRFVVLIAFTVIFALLARFVMFRLMKTAVTHAGSMGWATFNGVMSSGAKMLGNFAQAVGDRLGSSTLSDIGANLTLKSEVYDEKSRVWREATMNSLSELGKNPLAELPFSKAYSDKETSLMKTLAEHSSRLNNTYNENKLDIGERLAERKQQIASMFNKADPASLLVGQSINSTNKLLDELTNAESLTGLTSKAAEMGSNTVTSLAGLLSNQKIDFANTAHSTKIDTGSSTAAAGFANYLKDMYGIDTVVTGSTLSSRGSFKELSDLYSSYLSSQQDTSFTGIKALEEEGGRFISKPSLIKDSNFDSLINNAVAEGLLTEEEKATITADANGNAVLSETIATKLKSHAGYSALNKAFTLTSGRETADDVKASLSAMGVEYASNADGSFSVISTKEQADVLSDYNKALTDITKIKTKELDGFSVSDDKVKAIKERIKADGIADSDYYVDEAKGQFYFSPENKEYMRNLSDEFIGLPTRKVLATSSSSSNLSMVSGAFSNAVETGFGVIIDELSPINASKKIRGITKNGLAVGVAGLSLALETGQLITNAAKKNEVRIALNKALPEKYTYSIDKDNKIIIKDEKGEELTKKQLSEIYTDVVEEMDYRTIKRTDETSDFESKLSSNFKEGIDYEIKDNKIVLMTASAKQYLEKYNLEKWNDSLTAGSDNVTEELAELDCVDEVTMGDYYSTDREYEGSVIEFGSKTPVLTKIIVDILTGSAKHVILNDFAQLGVLEEDIVISPTGVKILLSDEDRAFYVVLTILRRAPRSIVMTTTSETDLTSIMPPIDTITFKIFIKFTGRDMPQYMTINLEAKTKPKTLAITYAVELVHPNVALKSANPLPIINRKLPYFIKNKKVFMLDLSSQKFKSVKNGSYNLDEALNVTGDIFYSEIETIKERMTGALMTEAEYRKSIAVIKEFMYCNNLGHQRLAELGVELKTDFDITKFTKDPDSLTPMFVPLALKALAFKDKKVDNFAERIEKLTRTADTTAKVLKELSFESAKEMLSDLSPEDAKRVLATANKMAREYGDSVMSDGLNKVQLEVFNKEVERLRKAGINTDDLLSSFKNTTSKSITKEDMAAIVNIKEE